MTLKTSGRARALWRGADFALDTHYHAENDARFT